MKTLPTRLASTLLLLAILPGIQGCHAQETFGMENLVLLRSIPLPGISGRIDHIDVDAAKGLAYVGALGNNSLEVIDLIKGKHLRTVAGLHEPQGVAYLSGHHEVFVANGGDGTCYFFDEVTFNKTGEVKLRSDADDVRYDSLHGLVYVGYGDGGLAVIDVRTHSKVADVPLPAHPESFQLDPTTRKIFVNVPGANAIDVIDMNTLKVVDEWKRNNLSANFPMTLNIADGQVIVGYRRPATLEVSDEAGHSLWTYPIVGDTDDLYYNPKNHEIYISGGSGYVNIFSENDHKGYDQIANILTRSGARTSYLCVPLKLFIVAARTSTGHEAELIVYAF